jgi:hypothetical protein
MAKGIGKFFMKSKEQSMQSFILAHEPSLFLQDDYDGSETWINEASESRLIQVNPG